MVLLPGVLHQFDKDADGGPVIRGITLKGNRLGSSEFNEKDPGVYDIVFVKDGKAVAVMEARFFAAESLGDKSDDDLRAMMKDF